MYPGFGPRPPGPPPGGGPWHCVGLCALALGLGIFIAAVFPVGALMFLVAGLLIACGVSSHLLRSWLLAQILVRRDGYENRGVEVSKGAQHAAAARVRREGGGIKRVRTA